MINNISIADYDYALPESLIAQHPVHQRDESKLLVYNPPHIIDTVFDQLPSLLQPQDCIVMNNSKVFPARLVFTKNTGAKIEIFCLEMLQKYTQKCVWKCMVGNLKRYATGATLSLSEGNITIHATLTQIVGNGICIVTFEYTGEHDFYKILSTMAHLPLPPYMQRQATDYDLDRYQTVYATHAGSVAAPTAGLHFTENMMQNFVQNNHKILYITLHVGMGTFKPVTVSNALLHEMHGEKFMISTDVIKQLSDNEQIVAVGTTSVRVLETLYHIAVRALDNNDAFICDLDQWEAYHTTSDKTMKNIFSSYYQLLTSNNITHIHGTTHIMIVPGYKFKVVNKLITNFHQPKSTLLLLLAAFIGHNWRKVYSHAVANNYRFLSYGDACLFSLNVP
ncbi:MAG: S-adenosylmethionine:tRNA ribosyltransferase-isomerase [Cytophagales bacterium]|nr:S-adenosylmethionine:tRNA ribosyltransferase-isomerase [Cytophagales bacterium]